MKWTSSVRFKDLKPQLLLAAIRVDEIYKDIGFVCWITSANDKNHTAPNSKHYTGEALDFRIFNIPVEKHEELLDRVYTSLGIEYDVILEKDHLHVEYDPK